MLSVGSLVSREAMENSFHIDKRIESTKTWKEVLVLAYYFPPMGLSGVQRTLKFVKYLPQYGWKPIVLTVAPTSYYAFDESLLDDIKEEVNSDLIKIYRTDTRDINKAAASISGNREFKMPKESSRRIMSMISQSLFIPDNKIGWKSFALAKADEIMKAHPNIELIFSTAPPFTSHLIALELRKKYQLPTVVDFRDPWVENPSHFYLTPIHKRKHKNLEEEVMLHADKIIAVNRVMKESFLRRYQGKLAHKSIGIVSHGYDAEDFKGMDSITKSDAKKFRLVYSGVFRDDRTPVPFFQGIKKAIEKNPNLKSDLELVFVGLFGEDHLKKAEKLGLKELIQVKGYLSHKETLKENLKADVLWATLGNVKHNETITLGKLFEYVACGKTIFGIVGDGASKNFIQEAKGVTASPENTDDIATKILDLYSLSKKNALPLPPKDVVKLYERKSLTEQLAREFDQLIFVE